MRHHNPLTATARLILHEVRLAKLPPTRTELAELTGSSSFTVTRITQDLVSRGLLSFHRIGGVNHYAIPQEDADAATQPEVV